MDQIEFEKLLHHQIPITAAMGFQVLEFSPAKVRLFAPLEPNINHKLTAFGGSIHCLLTVCGWAIMFANFKSMYPDGHIVIQKSQIEYLKPIQDNFYAECILAEEDAKQKMVRSLQSFDRGRMTVTVRCYCKNILAAVYEGTFAVMK